MAIPPRVERRGGRYHATARGSERRNVFRDDTVGSSFSIQTGGVCWEMDFAAVRVAVRRFSLRLARDTKLGCKLEEIEEQSPNVGI